MTFPKELLFTIALAAFAMTAVPLAADDAKVRYIVAFNDTVDADAIAAELGKKHGPPSHIFTHALKGMAGEFTAADVATLKADKRVRYVELDRILTLPPIAAAGAVKASGGGAITQPAQVIPNGIKRIFTPTTVPVGNLGIAVIDTGIDLTHPDLYVAASKSFTTRSSANDDNGHGSHVAGIIAAKNNSIGVVGVVPGAPLWAVKVLDRSGSGYTSWIVAGIDYVAANSTKIGVANMSLGGALPTGSDAMHDAIIRAVAKGVVFVVAAGNESTLASTKVPASYPEVITVSAIADTDGLPGGYGSATSYGVDDSFASFSNFGDAVDIAAPGVSIYSTWKSGGYNTISGTSMASPHVAGVVAAYLSTHAKPVDQAGTEAVRQAILANAIPQLNPEGFTGDTDAFAEPLVNAGPALGSSAVSN